MTVSGTISLKLETRSNSVVEPENPIQPKKIIIIKQEAKLSIETLRQKAH